MTSSLSPLLVITKTAAGLAGVPAAGLSPAGLPWSCAGDTATNVAALIRAAARRPRVLIFDPCSRDCSLARRSAARGCATTNDYPHPLQPSRGIQAARNHIGTFGLRSQW